jgi:U3 small nucleolar RNA-associated protein 4
VKTEVPSDPTAIHTVVWTVSVLGTGSIVSGDSMGNVKFWDAKMGTGYIVHAGRSDSYLAELDGLLVHAAREDGGPVRSKFWDAKMGTQTQSFRAHKADVLAMAVGSDGTSVFTSGVDQKTVEFRQVTVASSRVHACPFWRPRT